jgi:cytochrome b6-f complex iron-sulfur subunit
METEDSRTECSIRRRDLLKRAAGAGLVLALPDLLAPGEAAAPKWVAVGSAGQFSAGVPRRVTLPGGAVAYITRRDANRLTALSARCTHEGCLVGWDGSGQRFLCPCHGATFAAAGRNLSGPAKRPLESLAVIQRGQQVFVDIASAGGALRAPNNPHEKEAREERERDDDEHDRGHKHEDDD